MSKIIKGHNKKVTSKPCDQTPKCHCREKAKYSMEGNCQVNDVVYKYDVTRPLSKKVYLGLAEKENGRAVSIKQKSSFKHKRYSNTTTLSS